MQTLPVKRSLPRGETGPDKTAGGRALGRGRSGVPRGRGRSGVPRIRGKEKGLSRKCLGATEQPRNRFLSLPLSLRGQEMFF